MNEHRDTMLCQVCGADLMKPLVSFNGYVCENCYAKDNPHPAECVACGSPTGPIIALDDECPGWLCDDCYREVQRDHPDDDYGIFAWSD